MSALFAISDRGSVPVRERICTTRARHMNAAAPPASVTGTQQNDPAGRGSIHSCDAAGVCPLGPSEELVSACGYLDDFPEAFVMTQSVHLAGADMACTSIAP